MMFLNTHTHVRARHGNGLSERTQSVLCRGDIVMNCEKVSTHWLPTPVSHYLRDTELQSL